MSSLTHVDRGTRASAASNTLIRSLLVLRGAVGIWYAGSFLGGSGGDWNGLFNSLSGYLIIDGAIGILVAAAMYREGAGTGRNHLGSLAAMMLVDAVGRTMSGFAVRHWPGIPSFPVTAVIFIALMAVFTITLGVVEAGVILEEDVDRFGPRHARAQFSIPPVLFSAIVSVAFGVAAMFHAGDPPILRALLAGYVAAVGAAMLAMAWSRRPRK